MWHLPMSARRQYMSTMRSEAAGSTQMYRPSSPRRLKLGIPNGDSSLLASHTYMIYNVFVHVSRICQVDPSCSSGRLGSHQHYLTQTGRRKKLKTMSLFDLFQSEFIRFHTMNSTISSIRTLLEQFCVTSRCKSQKIHIFFLSTKGDKGGEHISPVHPTPAIAGMPFQLQTYPYRLRIFSLL